MLKIRRPLGRLIFNMGIAIPGKTVFLSETAPWFNYSVAIFCKMQAQDTLKRALLADQVWGAFYELKIQSISCISQELKFLWNQVDG